MLDALHTCFVVLVNNRIVFQAEEKELPAAREAYQQQCKEQTGAMVALGKASIYPPKSGTELMARISYIDHNQPTEDPWTFATEA